MQSAGKNVPALEWPEDCNAQACNETTEKIFQIFHENCHLDIACEDVCLFFHQIHPKVRILMAGLKISAMSA